MFLYISQKMSNWKGHIGWGMFFLVVIAFLDFKFFHYFFEKLDWQFFVIYSPLILFSFMLPDIDHRISQPRFIVTILFLIMIAYFIITKNNLYAIYFVLTLFVIWILPSFPGWGHRGHTHSIIFIGLVSFLVFLIFNYKISIIFFIGGFTHLILDNDIKLW